MLTVEYQVAYAAAGLHSHPNTGWHADRTVADTSLDVEKDGSGRPGEQQPDLVSTSQCIERAEFKPALLSVEIRYRATKLDLPGDGGVERDFIPWLARAADTVERRKRWMVLATAKVWIVSNHHAARLEPNPRYAAHETPAYQAL